MNQSDYFWSHPPRCLAGFILARHPLGDTALYGHGESLSTAFTPHCHCGSKQHRVLGHSWRNPDFKNVLVFIGPVALQCSSCEKITELMDTALHGYDAELGHGSTIMRLEGSRDAFACPHCNSLVLEPHARFEYPDDLFDPAFDPNPREDLFTWFSLYATCTSCKKELTVTDFECA